MVETLVAAVVVISLFTFLYNLIYPLTGGYHASLNYDDLDTKYIAFYIKEMLEVDYAESGNKENHILSSGYDGECLRNCSQYSTKEDEITYEGGENASNNAEGAVDRLKYTNQLCNSLSNGNDDGSGRNNQYFCNKFINVANVTKIYITNYDTTDLKNNIENTDYSRSFKKYVEYMPSHGMATDTTKEEHKRIIVEVEHDSTSSSSGKYYTYASMEVNIK